MHSNLGGVIAGSCPRCYQWLLYMKRGACSHVFTWCVTTFGIHSQRHMRTELYLGNGKQVQFTITSTPCTG